MEKVLPISTLAESSTVWHMTDIKLHSRGKGVTPVDDIVAKLEGQREEGRGRHRYEEKRASLKIQY
eukprot:evm.model.NODE_25303_length_1897_cov_19.234581.1